MDSPRHQNPSLRTSWTNILDAVPDMFTFENLITLNNRFHCCQNHARKNRPNRKSNQITSCLMVRVKIINLTSYLWWDKLTKKELQNIFDLSSHLHLDEKLPSKNLGARARSKAKYVEILKVEHYPGLIVPSRLHKKLRIKNEEHRQQLGIQTFLEPNVVLPSVVLRAIPLNVYQTLNSVYDSADQDLEEPADDAQADASNVTSESETSVLDNATVQAIDDSVFKVETSYSNTTDIFTADRGEGITRFKSFPDKTNCGPKFSSFEKSRIKTPFQILEYLYMTEEFYNDILQICQNPNQRSTAFKKDDFHSEIYYCEKKKVLKEFCDDYPDDNEILSDNENIRMGKFQKPLKMDDIRKIFTKDHIERYFCTLLFMDLVQYPRLEDYFGEKNKELFNKDFTKQMWRKISTGKLSTKSSISGIKLFMFINTHIRCYADKLQKFFWRQNRRFWNPYTRICLDETIVGFLGRCSHRQYIRGKPDSTGLKFFLLTDEMLFTYRSIFYHSYHPGVYNIIEDFISFLEPGHIFCADRYYGGLASAHILHDAGHGFILCTPQNRPKGLFTHLRACYEKANDNRKWFSADNGKFLVTMKRQTGKSKKFVYFLSNYIDYDDRNPDDLTAEEKLKKENLISKDNHQYNKLHCYVDQFDKQVKHLWNKHRTYKWTQSFLKYIFKCFLENSRVFFNVVHGVPRKNWIPKSDFLIEIVKDWTKKLTGQSLAPPRYLQFVFPKVYRKCFRCGKGKQTSNCSECKRFFCYECFFQKGHCFQTGTCTRKKMKKKKKSLYFSFLE